LKRVPSRPPRKRKMTSRRSSRSQKGGVRRKDDQNSCLKGVNRKNEKRGKAKTRFDPRFHTGKTQFKVSRPRKRPRVVRGNLEMWRLGEGKEKKSSFSRKRRTEVPTKLCEKIGEGRRRVEKKGAREAVILRGSSSRFKKKKNQAIWGGAKTLRLIT